MKKRQLKKPTTTNIPDSSEFDEESEKAITIKLASDVRNKTGSSFGPDLIA